MSANKTITFGTNLVPNGDLTNDLGTTSARWAIYGDLNGNAATSTTATNLSSAPTIKSGTTTVTDLSANTSYTLNIGGQSMTFKTPADANTQAAYGNITTAGVVTTTAVIATSDKILISDNSASGKVVASSISFDTTVTTKVLSQAGTWVDNPDTKNTAGSTATATKIFLVGPTSQTASAQTYSNTYVHSTDGVLGAKSFVVNNNTTANLVTLQWNATDSALEFVFA